MLVIANCAILMAVEIIWIRNLVIGLSIGFIFILVSGALLIRSGLFSRLLAYGLNSKFQRIIRGTRRVVELLSDESKLESVIIPSALA